MLLIGQDTNVVVALDQGDVDVGRPLLDVARRGGAAVAAADHHDAAGAAATHARAVSSFTPAALTSATAAGCASWPRWLNTSAAAPIAATSRDSN